MAAGPGGLSGMNARQLAGMEHSKGAGAALTRLRCTEGQIAWERLVK